MRLPLDLLTGSNLDADATSVEGVMFAVNMYQDRVGAWKHFPGRQAYCDLGNGKPIDGIYRMGALRVAVSGSVVWDISDPDNPVYLDTCFITPGTRVSFADDGSSIFFCGNSKVYEISFDGVFYNVGIFPTAAELDGVTSIVYHQGFLIMNSSDPVDGDAWYTDNLTGTWTPLEQYNNQLAPDALVALISTSNFIYNFGTNTTEVVYRDGAVPFSVNTSATLPFGTPAVGSVAFDGQSIYFLAIAGQARRVVQLLSGGSPKVISFPVDIPIDEMSRIDDAYGDIITVKGQTFYVLTFPTAEIIANDQLWHSFTIAYHVQSEKWVQLADWDASFGIYEAFPVKCYYYDATDNKKLYGATDGIIYEFAGNGTERGVIRTGRVRRKDLGLRKRCNRYTYDVKRGMGTYTTEQFFIHRWRDNGNPDWQERRISLGKLGETERSIATVDAWRCGIYQEREHEFVFDADIDVTLNAVIEDVERLA